MNSCSISPTKASIIIAAYNEATVIRKTLQRLVHADAQRDFQVLVICNGCTDNTEQIIHNEFESVNCFSIATASKALAIRYAESLNPGFPRLYLDADIGLSAVDAQALISKANDYASPALLIPSSVVATDQCSPWVNAFYRVWYNTPHVQTSGYGAGAYLVTQAGRKRFGTWPELVADDAYIRSQFNLAETHIVQSVTVQVQAPRTLRSLIKVKTRSKYGNLQLKAALQAAKPKVEPAQTKQEINLDTRNMPKVSLGDKAVYFMVNIIALCIAKWQFMNGVNKWQRDNSTR